MKCYILAAGLLLLTLSSCQDFLDKSPKTAVTPANFFQSREDFEQAVSGVYAPLQDQYENAWLLSEMHSDNTHFIFDVANRGSVGTEDIATFLVGPENTTVQTKWTTNYLIISRANQVLASIDDVSFDQAVKDKLKGEALFLRAHSYFDLVKNFGGVPFNLDPVESFGDAFKARSPANDIYDQIILDAQQAADLLPARANQTAGRATSGAAYTLLGDVYMTLEKWAEAEAALTAVKNMGYHLLPAYADIFKPTNEENEEIIFSIEYLEGTSLGLSTEFPYRMLPLLLNPSIVTGLASSPSMPQGLGGWNIPTPDIIAAYEDTITDTRYSASIGYVTGRTSAVSNPDHKHVPYIKKYQHPHALFRETGQDWIVYRYAEVLLLLAESLNEQGKPSEALVYLNQVRARAGLAPKTTASQSDLRDIILREQRVELAFENKRWPLLVRKKLAVSTMNAYGARIKARPQAYYYPPGNAPFSTSFNVTDNKLVYPIPLREILVNPDLKQNPGY